MGVANNRWRNNLKQQSIFQKIPVTQVVNKFPISDGSLRHNSPPMTRALSHTGVLISP
jgi:hypothetical protein